MGSNLKELSRRTLVEFARLVPDAETDIADSLATIVVDNKKHIVRIKRAKSVANQIQVWRGEPIVLHVPGKSGDRWYVLPVSWQLTYARKHATTAKQHASHAFDCMMLTKKDFPSAFRVEPEEIVAACKRAIKEAQTSEMRIVLKALTRIRSAVADILITTLEEELETQ